MHKKNKISLFAAPAKRPIPDYYNMHHFDTASIQTKKIKNYLQVVKDSHRGGFPYNYQAAQIELPRQSSKRSYQSLSNQEILRNRIAELELENNQFRIMIKQCQYLAAKNRELEEQMLMLLSQLQQEDQTEEQSPLRNIPLSNSQAKQIEEHSTIENVFTEESSKQFIEHETYPKAFKYESPPLRQQPNEVFKNVRIGCQKEPTLTQVLMSENQTIKDYIKQQVKQSIVNFEGKFMSYIQVIEEQMQQMKAHNQQMMKLKLNSSSHSKMKLRESNSSIQQKYRLAEFYLHGQRPIYNTPEYQNESKKEEHENSLVNIEMDNISDSEHSFGRSNKPHHKHSKLSVSHPLYTPDSYPQIHSVSHTKKQQEYSDYLIKKVLEHANGMRQNLAFLLGEQTKIDGAKLTDFENKICTQLQHILNTYFPNHLRNSSLLFQTHMDQGLLMKSRMRIMRDQSSQRNRQQQRISSNQIYRQVVDRNQGYELGIPRVCSEQFKQTQRKLLEVIQIMRTYNNQYRQMIVRKDEAEDKVEGQAVFHYTQ